MPGNDSPISSATPQDESVPWSHRPVRTRDKFLGIAVGAGVGLIVVTITWLSLGPGTTTP